MAEKPPQTLSHIIDSLLKPLHFASKDAFAHLLAIKNLEPVVLSLSKEALALSLSDNEFKKFCELVGLFDGFDGFETALKKERIKRAIEIVEEIRKDFLLPSSPLTPARVSLTPPQSGEGEKIRGEGEIAARPYVKKEAEKEDEGNLLSSQRKLSAQEILKAPEKLSTPLRYVKGIGPKLSERLKKKGLSTVEDVLYFLPIRYEDRRNIKKIRELEVGKNEVSFGEVMASGEVRYGNRKVFEAVVSDGAQFVNLKWFNYRLPYMKNLYKQGERCIFYGTVSMFAGKKEIIHPDVEFIMDEPDEAAHFKGVIPIYSQIDNMHQKTIRKIVRAVVEEYAPFAMGCVPEDLSRRCGMMELKDAFFKLHAPVDIPAVLPSFSARKAIIFDELFSLELGCAIKMANVKKEGGVSIRGKYLLEERLKKLLPFELTGAQKRVIEEIKKDMASPHPMNRLIQGDVGSGKTIVSYIAVLTAIEHGYQAAIMAPTEILAEQHYLNLHRYSEELGIKSVLLTGSVLKKERKKILEEIKNNGVRLIIGTHALIEKDVEFSALGLTVIDEQHRFGVVQRGEFKKKGIRGELSPHILVMTATPIPRTLSMTIFGDLDISIIDELPKGRIPIVTRVLREKDRVEAYNIIRSEVKSGHQAYIVYPLIEESEELSLKDATNMKEHLQNDIFSEFRVGLLHGRMKAALKESMMKDFKSGKTDILVSTTVIEVGVDVPNASVMLVEHAERFGLAQLHQLRGRVGRGEKSSTCLLLHQYTQSEDTWKRLKVLETTTDGFKIAEEDLKIRGPGDFIGTRQSGLPDFRSADIFADQSLLKIARREAFNYLENNPQFRSPESKRIREVVMERWKGRLELIEVG